MRFLREETLSRDARRLSEGGSPVFSALTYLVIACLETCIAKKFFFNTSILAISFSPSSIFAITPAKGLTTFESTP